MEEDFYIIDSTLALIKEVQKNLNLSKLDIKEDVDEYDANTLRKIANIVANLSKILKAQIKDARVIVLLNQVKGLKEFLESVLQAYSGNEKLKSWLIKMHGKNTTEEIDKELNEIISKLDSWNSLLKTKFGDIKEGNKHIEDIPVHEYTDRFYIKVKELIPGKTLILKQPVNPVQSRTHQERTNEQLMKYDEKDPISGRRFFRDKDTGKGPASGIVITQGHHRIHEIIRRYLSGRINGETLIEIKKD